MINVNHLLKLISYEFAQSEINLFFGEHILFPSISILKRLHTNFFSHD